MSFQPENMSRGAFQGSGVWHYVTSDTVDTMIASGYFNDAWPQLKVDDLIFANTTSGLAILNVTSVSTDSVSVVSNDTESTFTAGSITRSNEWTWFPAFSDGLSLYYSTAGNGGSLAEVTDFSLPVGGGLALTTGTTDNASSRLRTSVVFTLGSGPANFRMDISVSDLSDGTDTYEVAVGLSAGFFITVTDNNEILFRYTHTVNSGNWVCVSQDAGGGEVTTNTSVAPTTGSTRQVLEIKVNADGTQSEFYIDGTLVATHTTVPSASLRHGLVINKLAGTTARKLYPLGAGWDYIFDTPV